MATIPDTVDYSNLELVETDGEPLDSAWHRDEINFLVEVVRYRLKDRKDFFAGGNMFIYFSPEQARNKDYRGPDFFLAKGVRYEPFRPYWVVWEEDNKYPDVIIELSSHSTARIDRTIKKDIYQNTFRTPDYFIYDPDTEKLEGWRLVDQAYQTLLPNEKGRLWCEELGLWLGQWIGKYQGAEGTWIRFFDRAGKIVPMFAEAKEQRLKTEEKRREDAEERANSERQRTESEKERTLREKKRADEAEAEIARLKALLKQKKS